MAGIPGARDEEDEVPEPEETDNMMMNIGNINDYYEKTGKTPSWAQEYFDKEKLDEDV